jgi:anaerobic selenocysteine-containing dehydrogenase
MFTFLSDEPVHDPLAPSRVADTTVKCTTCYMCACRCGIRVHLREGDNGPEVRYIEGNPAHPLNKGVICAKGASGIMKQVSPARLTQPLLRKAGSERGAGAFEAISWERAYELLTERLAKIRATDPKQFALFTGRDQMQALTGLFARQFGTPNYAAHGGFCSVNMAAGMIYTVGGSFWEFGGPDLERAKLFVMIGTAEDHHSNPMKVAISKFKRDGGRFISINPVRTGYSAIADEWIPIRPGTDGALFMALLHELIRTDQLDHAFLRRFTNAPQLVVLDEGEREGLFAFDPDPARGPPGDGRHPHNKLVWDTVSGSVKNAYPEGIADGCDPALDGHYTLADGTRVAPSFQLLRERVAGCTPEWAAQITGIPAERIRNLAGEMGHTALQQAFELPIPWTDAWGKRHPSTQARPVAFHAMRGLAAHSNGFQTVRALAILMSVLGTIDAPGGFRHKAPYPRHIVPNYRAFNDPGMIQPNTPLNAAPLGFPAHPDELAIHPDGSPMRIDHAFSWEHPLSAHGLMHNVITNAARGDPYRIDTLMLFMANMAWNSTMNTTAVREMLNRKDDAGQYMIPFIVVCDAFQSETVAFADLVLPDTTYLERHDVMGMLDRPISEFDGPVDSVRVPVVKPLGECKPFQEVLIELAGRLQFPAFTTPEGARKFSGYTDFIVNFQPAPGVGFLMGWRGKDGQVPPQGRAESEAVGDVRAEQLRVPAAPARDHALHAQLEPGIPGFRQGRELAPAQRPDPARAVFRHAAVLPPGRAGQDAGPPAAGRTARTHRDLFRPAAVLVRAARRSGDRPRGVSAQRDHAAPDGDVPQLGFAERLAAPDPQPQLPACQSEDGAGGRHRGRRLVLGREPVGQGALHDPVQRGGGAGHGLDLERDRQGRRRLAAGTRCRRGAQGLPAEPPDLRRTAVQGRPTATRPSATPTRSPARPAGTTCACAYGRPRPRSRNNRSRSSPACRPRPAWSARPHG